MNLPKRNYVRVMTLAYVRAARALLRQGKKINAYTLGEYVGRDHSAVYRFMRAHSIIWAHIIGMQS